jgi:uncharacterized damage-inducible protein DinB
MAITDALLPELDREVGTTRKVLERVPDAQLGWKPHAKSMSIGELATHISNLPMWATTIVNETGFDMATAPKRPKLLESSAAIVSAFDTHARQMRQALAGRTDAELVAMWTLSRGAQQVFSVPRFAALRSFIMSHIVHHRGQLSVYLRLLDVPVPSIYGPSADEQQ